jgi:DNA repair exonuclease SbcCD ATPase subunit
MQAMRLMALATLITVTGCQSVYYGTLEQFGVHKREILIERIESAQEAQEEGQQQFKDALEQFQAVVNFDGGDLEVIYQDLDAEYEDSLAAATKIRDRISAVESVADALFSEWQAELDQYTNENLRRDSERQLTQTQSRFSRLMTSMHNAEKTLDPVLNSLKDNVLYLKHNLNARAITSLKGEMGTVNADISNLIKAMQKAINESEVFIVKMRQGTGA